MEGFPGVDNLIEWFGLNININFKLKIKVTGNHLFALISDDGSILNIDGVDVILNDGRHGSVRQDATVNLAAGSHTVNIRSFRSPVCNRTGVENEDSWRCGRDLYFSRSDQPSVGLTAKKKAQGAMRLLGLLFRRG